MARIRCVRCGVMGNTLDPPHLCADIKKRYERNAKAVEIVSTILFNNFYEAGIEDPSYFNDIAAEIVKALSGRDLGDN